MPNWINIVCPTFMHLLLSFSLFCLILTSIPFYSHHYSCIFTSQPWTSFSLAYYRAYDRILMLWNDCTTEINNKDWTWLKILFSSALPESEETAFEEQFKYLIVTSTVLNDTSSQQTGNLIKKNTMSNNSTYASSHLLPDTLTTCYIVMTTVVLFDVGLIVFFSINLAGALCFHWPHPSYSSLLFMQVVLLGILFTTHRKQRYTKIRQTYTRLLQHLDQILHATRISDRLMDQLVEKVDDVEMISQGHSLAPVDSALENPRSHLSPQTLRMKCMARCALAPYFKSTTNLLQLSVPLTHPGAFATLRGLYNIKELFSLSPLGRAGNSDEFIRSSFDYEQLNYLVYMIRSCRREWFLRLLALEMMTLGHDSARRDYEGMLATVEHMMVDMEQKTELIVKNLETTLTSDLYNGSLDHINDKKTDKRTRTVLNSLALLETHARNLQAKIILCRHDIKDKGIDVSFNKMKTRFETMEQDITSLLDQWDENKYAYDQQKSPLPSPPSSPSCIISKRESIRRSFTTKKTDIVSTTTSSSTSSGKSSPSQQQSSASSSPISAPQISSMHSDHLLYLIDTSPLNHSHQQSWIMTDMVASMFESKHMDGQKHQEKFAGSARLSSSQELPSGTMWSSTSNPSPCVTSLGIVGD